MARNFELNKTWKECLVCKQEFISQKALLCYNCIKKLNKKGYSVDNVYEYIDKYEKRPKKS